MINCASASIHRLSAFVLLVGIADSCAPYKPEAAHSSAQQSCPQSWSWSQPVAVGPTSKVTRSPSMSDWHGGRVVAGTNVHFFLRPAPDTAVFIWATGSGDLGHPGGDFVFVAPSAVTDAHGRLHLLWGEPAVPPPPARRGGDVVISTSLWSAAYDPLTGWSTSSKVLEGRDVRWRQGGAALAGGDGGSVNGVVGVSPRQVGDPKLVSLALRGGAWRATSIPGTEEGAIYPSIALSGDSTVYVAYIAGLSEVDRDRNSVFLTSSPDGGVTWTSRQLISQSGEKAATEVNVLVGRDGGVHLVWGQNLSGGLDAEVIRYTRSGDAGTSWSAPVDFTPEPGFSRIHAAIDRCDVVHVVYDDWRGGGNTGHLDYVRFNPLAGQATHLFRGLMSQDPTLHRSASGAIHLAFVGRAEAAAMMEPLKTWLSFLQLESGPR
jgi:hypothetical protein